MDKEITIKWEFEPEFSFMLCVFYWSPSCTPLPVQLTADITISTQSWKQITERDFKDTFQKDKGTWTLLEHHQLMFLDFRLVTWRFTGSHQGPASRICDVCQTVLDWLLLLWAFCFSTANGEDASSASFQHEWTEWDIRPRNSWRVHSFTDISRSTHQTSLFCLGCLHPPFDFTSNNDWLTIYSAKHTKVGLCNDSQCKEQYSIHISGQRTLAWKY